MSDQSIVDRLAAFAACLPAADIPSSARAMMRLSLFDWAVVARAGRGEPVARILRRMVLAEGGAPEATLAGSGVRVPARAAALANGATSHALDYDDTHFAHIGHLSVAVIPAALAMAERQGAGGAEMLDAALLGAEVAVRVGVWLGRGHYESGFHQTATAGTFGAAMAAARLLRLDAGQAAHALGLASTRAAGLKSQFGTMGKPYNAGNAAAGGLEAALMVGGGLVSDPAGLDGDQGFGPTHAGAADPAALEGLGRAFLVEAISYKFHACCHGTHAALEALRTLRDGLNPEAVAGVVLTVHPRWLRVCNLARPRTGLEAKFSLALTGAMVLAGQDTGALTTFSDAACTDAALIRLRDRVRVAADPEMAETAAFARLEMVGGAVCEARHDLAAPIPREALSARLGAKAAALIGAREAGALRAMIDARGGPDIAALAGYLGR